MGRYSRKITLNRYHQGMCGTIAWRVLQAGSFSKEHAIWQKTVISAIRPTPQVVLKHGRSSSIFCYLIKPNP